MGDGEKAKEVVLDSTTVEKGKFSFSGVHQMPDIAIIKDMDGETYPLIFEKGEISVNIDKICELGWNPKIGVEEGFKRTVMSFLESEK